MGQYCAGWTQHKVINNHTKEWYKLWYSCPSMHPLFLLTYIRHKFRKITYLFNGGDSRSKIWSKWILEFMTTTPSPGLCQLCAINGSIRCHYTSVNTRDPFLKSINAIVWRKMPVHWLLNKSMVVSILHKREKIVKEVSLFYLFGVGDTLAQDQGKNIFVCTSAWIIHFLLFINC